MIPQCGEEELHQIVDDAHRVINARHFHAIERQEYLEKGKNKMRTKKKKANRIPG